MNDSSAAVVLPCSTQDFGNFISSLLGKPQTISNSVKGPFEIVKGDIQNVHLLLEQRIQQQNESSLTQFTAKLIFSDDSSVLLNSIEEFLTYNEVRPIYCTALHLTWVFLIKFKDKNHPEKQQIDLSFLAGGDIPQFDRDIPSIIFHRSGNGLIIYRISHTARTWGADIDSLLNAHLRGLVDEIPKFRKFLAKHDNSISILTFCLLFLASIICSFVSTASFVASQKSKITQIEAINTVNTVTSAQMKYLLDTVASGMWERFLLFSIIFLLFSFVLSIGMSMWVGATADNLPPSFLLLTKESEKRKLKILSRSRLRWFSFIGSMVVTFAIGIAGNICYALWFEKLIK